MTTTTFDYRSTSNTTNETDTFLIRGQRAEKRWQEKRKNYIYS